MHLDHAAFKHIGANRTIQDWIKNGVPLNFKSSVKPTPFELSNHNFIDKHYLFLEGEIETYLATGIIKQCDTKPTCDVSSTDPEDQSPGYSVVSVTEPLIPGNIFVSTILNWELMRTNPESCYRFSKVYI